MIKTYCENQATHIVYWPGRNKWVVCEHHMEKLRERAKALGFRLIYERTFEYWHCEVVTSES